MESPEDRIKSFIHVINMFLIIGMMGPIIPDGAPEMFKEHRSSMNNSIYIDSDHIKKECTGYTEWTRLRELYQLIDSKAEEFPYVIRPYYKDHFDEFYEESLGNLTLYLKPLGYDTYPQTGEELIFCLECVLYALRALHKHDWVHRDVRWPNILKLEDKSWMLIDLENAVPKREDGTFANVPSDFKDYNKSPRSKEQLNWLPCDDIWMVGNLVLSLSMKKDHDETVSEKLITFAKQLTTQNHSAEQALELIQSLKGSP